MPREQTIVAFFPSRTKAEGAVQALSAAGLYDAHIKLTSRFGISRDNTRNNAAQLQAETLTGLTLFSANTPASENQAERVLMGADPSVSGMSARGYGLPGGHTYTVVVFAPAERVEEAVSILKQNNGEV